MIFYYTATGNSLYIAKKMQDDTLISIPQALKQEKLSYEDDVIGIVCPDYAAELPRTVRTFLERAELKAKYIWMLVTYGREHSVVCTWARDFAEKNGIHLNYVNAVLMVDNWLPVFDMVEEMSIDKKIPEQLEKIQQDIAERREFVEPSSEHGIQAYAMVSRRNQEHPEWSNGTAIQCNNDLCIGCGICTRVCPVGRNTLVNGKRGVQKETCDFCLACVHACPRNALSLTIGEKNPDVKYRHACINLNEIIASNEQ